MAASELEIRTYGNWRRPTSGGLMGLGSIGTVFMFGWLVCAVLVTGVSGLGAGLIAFGIGVGLWAMIITKDVHGQSLGARMGARLGWWAAHRRGGNMYRSGPIGAAAGGHFRLPGVAAQLEVSEARDGYDRPFAMIWCPKQATYTVVLSSDPDGAALVDTEQIDIEVATWGRWLSGLADESGLIAASVTVETAPDPGTRLRREVTSRQSPSAPEFAANVLGDVMESYPSGSSTVRSFITATFKAAVHGTGRKRDADEMARVLATRMRGMTGGLAGTGAGAVRPVDAQELCEIVRTAYDPSAAELIEEANAAGDQLPLQWADVGPVAADATWDSYHHDDAWSRTWAMSEAPRGVVQSHVLARVLAPNEDVARKRVTLLFHRVPSSKAPTTVEKDLDAAEMRKSSARRASARAERDVSQAKTSANEEASGAGLVEFGCLITATVAKQEAMEDMAATMEDLAASSRLRVRTVFGSQDSAFAAALPLGLVLREHLTVSASLQGKI